MTDGAVFTQRGLAPLRGARAAFVFMTRIPVGGFPYSDADWRWAPAHFPLVGIVVGGCCALGSAVLASVDATVAALFAVAVGVLLTGAFHEDGLADTADALGGSHGGKDLLEILKDSRIGTYGAVALMLALGLRVACLVALGVAAPVALLLSHVFARTGPVWLIAGLPYVTGSTAKGSAFAEAGWFQAFVATIWPLVVAVLVVALGGVGWGAVAVAAWVSALATLLLGVHFRARAGGITGDFLGATEQVVEGLVLLSVLFVIRAAAS